ncbi:MAG: phosphate ABC transporter permease PstA [Candidatus Sumerlaeota bacterium]
MRLSTRKLLDKAFTSIGGFSIILMASALLVILAPIFFRGAKAFVFRETIEHRRFVLEEFNRGNPEVMAKEKEQAQAARKVVYEALENYEAELFEDLPAEPVAISEAEEDALSREEKRTRRNARNARKNFMAENEETFERLEELKELLADLLGPLPGERVPVLPRDQYGAPRWSRAQKIIEQILFVETWDYSDPTAMGNKVLVPRVDHHQYRGTALEPLFPYVEEHGEDMLLPRWKFYLGFLLDKPVDHNMFGGIYPAVLGTFYLTFMAMLFATPFGVIAAIYFVEYAGDSKFVSLLRVCVSTLAGVPSIVFGLFGAAFLIDTIHISPEKSVLAGAITLALLVLPTVIRSSEEAIKAVPQTYREAAMGLGASKWRTITTVILPAALSGILTGVIISMGRAAGETAPIIFTAAVTLGEPLNFLQLFDQPTPALPWAIYSIATEHPEAHKIQHVQYGMVVTLVGLVLMLNLLAIVTRARVSRKLRG